MTMMMTLTMMMMMMVTILLKVMKLILTTFQRCVILTVESEATAKEVSVFVTRAGEVIVWGFC